MLSRVLPSKLVDERITVTFDFRDQLEWGETLQSYAIKVSVASGVDGSPELLIFRSGLLFETRVEQKFYEGVPGVIYDLTCTVRGTTGNLYDKVFKLAVLPVAADPPPLTAIFLTSRPYPIDVQDGVGSSPVFSSHWFHSWPPEGVSSTPSFVSGTIADTLVTYVMGPEGLVGTPDFFTGSVYEQLAEYTLTPDGVVGTPEFWTGTVETILIQYTAPPEGLVGTPAFVSGTIT